MNNSSHETHADIQFRMLTPAQIAMIHQASLDILERTGVVVRDSAALELLRQADATIDGERVRLRPPLVEAALKTAPRSVAIYHRDGRPAMRLEGWNSYFG